DRLRLMRATRSNPEPIYGLYEDASGYVARAASMAAEGAEGFIVNVDGDTHEVRRIDDPEARSAVQKFLQDQRIWIADGHHRYETALAYQLERNQDTGGRKQETVNHQPSTIDHQPHDSILIVLTSFTDPGVVVLPTHRLVKNI